MDEDDGSTTCTSNNSTITAIINDDEVNSKFDFGTVCTSSPKTSPGKHILKHIPPSGNLTRLTAARYADLAALEKLKTEIKDDPWWDKRGSKTDGLLMASPHNKYDDVSSRLMSPTSAYTISIKEKVICGKEKERLEREIACSPSKSSSSPTSQLQSTNLLKPTLSYTYSCKSAPNTPSPSKKSHDNSPSKYSLLDSPSQASPPSPTKRLLKPTTATLACKWRNKEEIDAELLQRQEEVRKEITVGVGLKVKETSSRLLQATKAHAITRKKTDYRKEADSNLHEQKWDAYFVHNKSLSINVDPADAEAANVFAKLLEKYTSH